MAFLFHPINPIQSPTPLSWLFSWIFILLQIIFLIIFWPDIIALVSTDKLLGRLFSLFSDLNLQQFALLNPLIAVIDHLWIKFFYYLKIFNCLLCILHFLWGQRPSVPGLYISIILSQDLVGEWNNKLKIFKFQVAKGKIVVGWQNSFNHHRLEDLFLDGLSMIFSNELKGHEGFAQLFRSLLVFFLFEELSTVFGSLLHHRFLSIQLLHLILWLKTLLLEDEWRGLLFCLLRYDFLPFLIWALALVGRSGLIWGFLCGAIWNLGFGKSLRLLLMLWTLALWVRYFFFGHTRSKNQNLF